MKKIISIISVVTLLITGCANKEASTPAITLEDFSLYDHDGREVDFLTVENDFISVFKYDEESSEIQTYREVRIGDRATTALLKYNLSDFSWHIASDLFSSEAREEARELKTKYEEYSTEEMLEYIPEITAIENMEIIFSCSLYEYEGNYLLENELPRNDKDGMFLSPASLTSYRISIYVEAEKIDGIILTLNK